MAAIYPSDPNPQITPIAKSEKKDSFLNDSRANTLDRCTSINDIFVADIASRIATEVWVKAAGFIIKKSALIFCIISTISNSLLLWIISTSRSSFFASSEICLLISAKEALP